MGANQLHKVGRGGAGNYYEQADISQKDVEAQSPTALTTTASRPHGGPSDYSHLGRGGAGNWVSAEDREAPRSEPSNTMSMAVIGPEKAHRGRGGAGNYVAGDGVINRVEDEQLADERRRKEEEVTRAGEAGPRPPQKAYLVRERPEKG